MNLLAPKSLQGVLCLSLEQHDALGHLMSIAALPKKSDAMYHCQIITIAQERRLGIRVLICDGVDGINQKTRSQTQELNYITQVYMTIAN